MPPKVSSYMSTEVVTAGPDDSIAHIRNLMLRHGISRVVILGGGNRLLGIVTMTDILRIYSSPKLLRRPLDMIPAREVMTENITTINVNNSVEDAARVMVRKNIGSLPVIDKEGNIVGIITRQDLLKAVADDRSLKDKALEQYYDIDPPQVSPFHTIVHVAEVMESKPYSKAIVVDNRIPVGIIARRDIVFLDPSLLVAPYTFKKRDKPLPKGRTGGVRTYLVPVAQDVMTRDPITLEPGGTLHEAASLMVEHGIGAIPIVDKQGDLLGVVAKVHILAAYVGQKL